MCVAGIVAGGAIARALLLKAYAQKGRAGHLVRTLHTYQTSSTLHIYFYDSCCKFAVLITSLLTWQSQRGPKSFMYS